MHAGPYPPCGSPAWDKHRPSFGSRCLPFRSSRPPALSLWDAQGSTFRPEWSGWLSSSPDSSDCTDETVAHPHLGLGRMSRATLAGFFCRQPL